MRMTRQSADNTLLENKTISLSNELTTWCLVEPPFYLRAHLSYWHPPFSVSFTLTITIVDENITQVYQKISHQIFTSK